jgi:hypothetical protein
MFKKVDVGYNVISRNEDYWDTNKLTDEND